MIKSYPSTKITLGDVPEAREFRAKFIYNFFTKDEGTNAFGGVPDSVRRLPAESFDSTRIDLVRRYTPRFVRFDFIPVTADDQGPNEFVTVQDSSGRGSSHKVLEGLRRNVIQDETTFSNNRFTGLNFQDDNIDGKLLSIVSGSIAKRVTAHNRLKQQQIIDLRQQIIDSIIDQHSLVDAARALADQTSEDVSDNFVVNALNNIRSLSLSFIDDEGTDEMIDTAFEDVKDVSMKAQFNNKIVGTIVKGVVDDPMSPFSDEFASLLADASLKQEESILRSDPGLIQQSDFDSLFEALDVMAVDAENFSSTIRYVGYIIDKHELRPGQKPIRRPSIVIEDPFAASTIDVDVAYGSMYVYTVRTIAELTVKTVLDDSDDVVVATGLVSSRTSPRRTVRCVETVPPPPPADINAHWDFARDNLVLMWNFPNNPQQDIKKFQVFRRSTVEESFKLIRELDFDDSDVKVANFESPDAALVDRLDFPMTFFRDEEFTRDSKFIYSVCCVDAHQLTSNYSLQLEISFDRLANRLVKRLISVSGAPKSYPNLQLNQDLFVDTIKTSGKTRCRVYFDPEFLEVRDRDGNDLRLLTYENVEGGMYRLQLINTDVLKQEVVRISLDDKRLPR